MKRRICFLIAALIAAVPICSGMATDSAPDGGLPDAQVTAIRENSRAGNAAEIRDEDYSDELISSMAGDGPIRSNDEEESDESFVWEAESSADGTGVVLTGFHPSDVHSPVIVVPDTWNGQSVVGLGDGLFKECWTAMSIVLPQTLVEIGDNVFQGCAGLPELRIPEGVTSMGSSAVADCSALQAVSLPDSLESIGESCFASDVSLREIVLPAHLQHIGQKAFAGCKALKTIVYGNSAAKWKEQAESGQDYPAATYVWCSDAVLIPEGEEVPKITCSVRETEDYAPERLKKGMTLVMECTFTGVPNGVMVEPQLEGFRTSETAWKSEHSPAYASLRSGSFLSMEISASFTAA